MRMSGIESKLSWINTYLLRRSVLKPAIVGVVNLTAKVHDLGSLFSGEVHVYRI
jgi:hypothetical protein